MVVGMGFLGEGGVCPWAEAVVTSAHVAMGHGAGVRWVFIPASHGVTWLVTRVIFRNRTSPAWAPLCFPALWHTQSRVFEPSPVATWMFPSDSKNGDWCNCWFPGALKQIIRSHRTRCKMEASCFTRYRGSKCQSSEHFQHRCHRALPWEGKMPWVCWE